MILKDDIERLAEQANLKKLITGDYLKDTNNENFLYIKDKFFKGGGNETEQIRKTKLLNVGSGLFTMITETISKYVGNPSVQFYFPTKELVRDYLTYSFACFQLVRQNGKLKIAYLPAESYYERNGVSYILRFYSEVTRDNLINQYYLVTSYTGGVITNELFKLAVKDTLDLNIAEKVPLTTLVETAELEERIDTGLEQVFFIIRQSKLDKDKSIIEKIKSIVYSIDRKEAMLETQYLQHGDVFLKFAGIDRPQGFTEGSTLKDLPRFIFTDNESAKIDYVRNENPLLKDAKEQAMIQLEKISGITGVPLDFLGASERVGSIGEDSRSMLHGNFVKTIQNIRELFDETIKLAIQLLKKEDTKISEMYMWEDIIIKSDKSKAEELLITYGKLGIISKETALKIYKGLSEDEIKEEFIKINEDVDRNLDEYDRKMAIVSKYKKEEIAKENEGDLLEIKERVNNNI